jgi:hypothetical protein
MAYEPCSTLTLIKTACTACARGVVKVVFHLHGRLPFSVCRAAAIFLGSPAMHTTSFSLSASVITWKAHPRPAKFLHLTGDCAHSENNGQPFARGINRVCGERLRCFPIYFLAVRRQHVIHTHTAPLACPRSILILR